MYNWFIKVTILKVWFILNWFFFRFVAHTARRHIDTYSAMRAILLAVYMPYSLYYYKNTTKNVSKINVFDWFFIKIKAQIIVSSYKFFLFGHTTWKSYGHIKNKFISNKCKTSTTYGKLN